MYQFNYSRPEFEAIDIVFFIIFLDLYHPEKKEEKYILHKFYEYRSGLIDSSLFQVYIQIYVSYLRRNEDEVNNIVVAILNDNKQYIKDFCEHHNIQPKQVLRKWKLKNPRI